MSSSSHEAGSDKQGASQGGHGELAGKALDHARHPRNEGEFPKPDGIGRASLSCGDTIQIVLRVKDGTIDTARFLSTGCGAGRACGSVTTEMVQGKPVAEAFEVTHENILRNVEGLPESEAHCAILAEAALKAALRDYLSLRREPWKKSYRSIRPL